MGAGTGSGQGIALAFAKAGAAVALHYSRSSTGADTAVATIRQAGGAILVAGSSSLFHAGASLGENMRRTREASVLDELLTDQFSGVVTCDRAKMYWRLGRLQWCWAHLIRDFQAMIDRGNAQAKRLGYDLRRAAKTLFRHWTDYRGGAISWAAVQRRLAPVRREVER